MDRCRALKSVDKRDKSKLLKSPEALTFGKGEKSVEKRRREL